LGLVWFLAAIALAPSNKVYQQGLVLFLWLPTLVLAWSARQVFILAAPAGAVGSAAAACWPGAP
jgi:hypothetical protein